MQKKWCIAFAYRPPDNKIYPQLLFRRSITRIKIDGKLIKDDKKW